MGTIDAAGMATMNAEGEDRAPREAQIRQAQLNDCLLYTSDAADERSSVDLGGRRIIKTKTQDYNHHPHS